MPRARIYIALSESGLVSNGVSYGNGGAHCRISVGRRATLEDLGWNLHAALISHNSGPIEMMAGDLETAEAELRRDYEALEKMGLQVVDASQEGWGVLNHDLFLSNAHIWKVIRAAIDARAADAPAGRASS